MSTPPTRAPDEQLLRRARAEFLEMPGMRLTVEQAQRLWGLDGDTCGRVLQALVDVNFLGQGSDRRYGRLSEGGLPLNASPTAKTAIRSPAAATR